LNKIDRKSKKKFLVKAKAEMRIPEEIKVFIMVRI